MLRIAILATFALFSSLAYSAGLLPAVNADMGCTGSNQSVYYNGTNIVCGALGGSGNVSNVATPTNGQIAQWTSATTIQGLSTNTSGGVPLVNGSITTGHCLQWNSSSGITDAGVSCGTGGGTTWGADSFTAYNGDGSGGLSWSTTNSNAASDPNFGVTLKINSTQNATNLNPGFTTAAAENIILNSTMGRNVYGNGTNSKVTYYNLGLTASHYGAGQRFLLNTTMNCYGMGDCFINGGNNLYFGSANIGGDEGAGWQSVSTLGQTQSLARATINTVYTPTSCNTNLTQNVTASKTAQTVTVASSTGCNVNDWVVINQIGASSHPNTEAVKLTAVAAGSITGVFTGNYTSGQTVTPAQVLYMNGLSSGGFGQDRVLVNLTTASSYTTGTAAGLGGGAITGVGTSWASNMVGGSSINPGCIALSADDYTGTPFAAAPNQLEAWYQITAVSTTTSLSIYSNSVAGDASYRGNGTSQGNYTIRPCARILNVGSDQRTIVLESNSFTWTVGDSLEQVIAPYPDVTGYFSFVDTFTPGTYRAIHDVENTGPRTFQNGIQISGQRRPNGNTSVVYAGSWSGGTVTLSYNGTATYSIGSLISVKGITGPAYNGNFIVTANSVGTSTGTVSYALASNPGAYYGSGGSISTNGVDPFAFTVGLLVNEAQIGISTNSNIGLNLLSGWSIGPSGSTPSGKICWGAATNVCLGFDLNFGGYWQMATNGAGGMLFTVNGSGSGYGTIGVTDKFAMGNVNYQTTFDATGVTAARSVTVPDIGGTLLIGTSATAASVPANFSATTYIPINIGGTTYYVAAKTASW